METVTALGSEIITSSKLLVALIVPLLGSFLVSLSGKKPNLRETWSVVSAIILFLIVGVIIGVASR